MSDLTRRCLLPNKIPARGKKDPEKHGNSSSLGRFERNLRIPVYAEGEAPKLVRKIIYLVKVNDFERSYQQNMGKKGNEEPAGARGGRTLRRSLCQY